MSDSQQQKICLKHQQVGFAIDLNQSLGYEYRFICERCVQENYFSKNNILLINEVQLELNSMKSKQREIQIKIINRKLEQLTSLEILVQNYIDIVKKNHQLVIELISNQIQLFKNQLEQLNDSQNIEINEQEIKILSLYVEKDRVIDSIQQQQDQDQQKEYFQKIKDYLEILFQNDQQKIIVKQMDELLQTQIQNEENIEQKQNYSSADKVQFQCNLHNEYQKMVTLESGDIEQRLFCLECVEECKYKRCSIKKMNGLWIETQEQIISKKYQFNQQRLLQHNEILQIIIKLKEKQQILLEEAQLLSQNQIKKISQQTELLKLKKNKIKSIFQMELEEIKEAANYLAQTDKMMNEKKYEIEIQNEDGVALLELSQKFELLNQIQKECESQIKLSQLNQQNQPNVSNSNDQTLASHNDLQETSKNLNQSCRQNCLKFLENQINVKQYIESVQEILQKYPNSQIQGICEYIDDLPIALILDKTDKGMLQMEKILFRKAYYKRILEEQNQMYFITTEPFDFDDIDERERQIEQYKKVFKRYPNKFAAFLITVPFERIDIMKKNVMDIYKFTNKLEVPISIIITDFHLSENKVQDQKLICSKFALFKPKQLIFIGNNTNKQDLIQELKKTLSELKQNNCYPMKIKDTLFDDENEEETQQLIEQFKQQFQKL